MKINMNINEFNYELLQGVLIKRIFELTFPDQNLDNFTKTDLAYFLIQMDKEAISRIKKAKDPANTIDSRKLVYLYIKSRKNFPPLQKKLLKILSNQKMIKFKTLAILVYKDKDNDDNYTALRKLISETNKTLVNTNSGGVYRIINKKGLVCLNIDDTNLQKNVKKRSQKITK